MAVQFPNHDVNPNLKNEDWLLKYARAAWDEYTLSPAKIFYNNRKRYAEIEDYLLGKQSVDKYKKALNIDESGDSSWLNTDWTTRPVAAKLMDIIISKLIQRTYNVNATPIDALAKDEKETYYAEAKAKILLREQMKEIAPELADTPVLKKQMEEPEDLEELEMAMNFGPKMKTAMEAEMGIDYVFYHNNFREQREENFQSLANFGVGAYKEWVDENGEVKHRNVDIKNMITSWCRKKDFSDVRYIGEVVPTTVGELPFSPEIRKEICEKVAAKNMGYGMAGKGGSYDKETVHVLDLELITYNDRVYEQRQNKSGNLVFRRSDPANKTKDNKVVIDGKETPKYINKPIQMIYKVKWVIDTDYVYDCGPATYQKREPGKKELTSFSYHIRATQLYSMTTSSIFERLIPIIDEYHVTSYKVQNFKNKWIPYVINLDLAAMENVALGAGGEKMDEKEILELVFSNFVALGRRMDATTGVGQNYKMVDIEPTGMGQEYNVLVGDLARLFREMRDVTGLNDLTDGSTPGERTLNGVASLADMATNNALYPIIFAEKSLTESLAKGCILRLVQTIKDNPLSGVIRTIGDESAKYIRVTKDIADRLWDIKLEERPSDQQKDMLIQQMNIKESQGLVTPEDIIMIQECTNLKQARMLMAYRIKKRMREKQDEQAKLSQINGQVQIQSAQAAEESKRQTLQLEYDLKLRNELEIKKAEERLLLLKLQGAAHAVETNAAVKALPMVTQDEPGEAPGV